MSDWRRGYWTGIVLSNVIWIAVTLWLRGGS